MAKQKIIIVWDSQDPDTEPTLYVPPELAEKYERIPLNRSQELGGRFPNTDPADIALLEAGTNGSFPNYKEI